MFAAVNDPQRPRPIPPVEDVPPALNFAPLENAAIGADARRRPLHNALAAARGPAWPPIRRASGVNARLMQSERQFIDEQGLPRRAWYRHLLYAPGYYTGYGVKTMPGVREAIEDKRYAEVEPEVVRVAAALNRETALLEGLAADLERLIR